MSNRIRRLLVAGAAVMLSTVALAEPAHAASWHTFWSGSDYGHQAHVCSPSLSSSHHWKLFVDYEPYDWTLKGRVDMARYNDDNHTHAAWVRYEGFYSLSSGYLTGHQHACATTLPGTNDDGQVLVSAQWYG